LRFGAEAVKSLRVQPSPASNELHMPIHPQMTQATPNDASRRTLAL
jgi:hypothetical protein